ncbi:hypothetical protein AVEN_164309-1, partial [Araneus ventricosus]
MLARCISFEVLELLKGWLFGRLSFGTGNIGWTTLEPPPHSPELTPLDRKENLPVSKFY